MDVSMTIDQADTELRVLRAQRAERMVQIDREYAAEEQCIIAAVRQGQRERGERE